MKTLGVEMTAMHVSDVIPSRSWLAKRVADAMSYLCHAFRTGFEQQSERLDWD
jgi:hypothetical protein